MNNINYIHSIQILIRLYPRLYLFDFKFYRENNPINILNKYKYLNIITIIKSKYYAL